MTPQYAEITFVVERDTPDSTLLPPRSDCARGRSGAQHNPILGISFSQIHGFAADLLEIRPTMYARTRGVPG
jgi:hypothetical protein